MQRYEFIRIQSKTFYCQMGAFLNVIHIEKKCINVFIYSIFIQFRYNSAELKFFAQGKCMICILTCLPI